MEGFGQIDITLAPGLEPFLNRELAEKMWVYLHLDPVKVVLVKEEGSPPTAQIDGHYIRSGAPSETLSTIILHDLDRDGPTISWFPELFVQAVAMAQAAPGGGKYLTAYYDGQKLTPTG